jgi:glutaredoxin
MKQGILMNQHGIPRLKTAVVAALLALTAITATTGVNAQTVYRIVGADGKVTFSDKPPLTDDKVTATGRNGRTIELANNPLPFELRQPVSRYPVTLYTSSTCNPCNTGRSYLNSRGIPFTERTVNTPQDGDAMNRLGGENTLPMLTIGGQKLKGFSEQDWSQYLDAAGYPTASKLPAGYRNPSASPLVAIQKPAPAETEEQKAEKAERAAALAQPAPVNNTANPAGIKF